MSAPKKHIQFQGQAGLIDCALDWPSGATKGWALILHPHPLQGGTRDNKVVTTLARACVQAGLVAVRPNFRGIGLSQGQFDHGEGESADMLAVVQQFTQAYPDITAKSWVLGGFSFGTSVAAQLYSVLTETKQALPQALVLAGPAIARFRFREVSLPPDTLLIHGEDDDVVPLSETMDYARDADLPVVVIPGAGHFFHGKLIILRGLVEQRLNAVL